MEILGIRASTPWVRIHTARPEPVINTIPVRLRIDVEHITAIDRSGNHQLAPLLGIAMTHVGLQTPLGGLEVVHVVEEIGNDALIGTPRFYHRVAGFAVLSNEQQGVVALAFGSPLYSCSHGHPADNLAS